MTHLKSLLVLTLASTGAFALSPPRTLGSLSISGGGPLPPWVKPRTFTCTIVENYTHKILEVGGQIERQETVATRYDSEVPDARTALALARTAAGGALVQQEGPTDVPTRSYLASADGGPATVNLGSFGPRIFENTSPAAKVLRGFVDLNCKLPSR